MPVALFFRKKKNFCRSRRQYFRFFFFATLRVLLLSTVNIIEFFSFGYIKILGWNIIVYRPPNATVRTVFFAYSRKKRIIIINSSVYRTSNIIFFFFTVPLAI